MYSQSYAELINPEAPPLVAPALEWGAFMALSGNWRQGLAIVPFTFFSSTPALLRDYLYGGRDQAAEVELEKVEGTIVSSRALQNTF